MRVTPEEIGNDLPKNVVFVFGSNESGLHGAGTAYLAWKVYGAQLGVGFGMTAQAFAIPTKDWDVNTLPLSHIEFYVKRFIAHTRKYTSNKWKYYVTKIGCGLAGYIPEDIAPFF